MERERPGEAYLQNGETCVAAVWPHWASVGLLIGFEEGLTSPREHGTGVPRSLFFLHGAPLQAALTARWHGRSTLLHETARPVPWLWPAVGRMRRRDMLVAQRLAARLTLASNCSWRQYARQASSNGTITPASGNPARVVCIPACLCLCRCTCVLNPTAACAGAHSLTLVAAMAMAKLAAEVAGLPAELYCSCAPLKPAAARPLQCGHELQRLGEGHEQSRAEGARASTAPCSSGFHRRATCAQPAGTASWPDAQQQLAGVGHAACRQCGHAWAASMPCRMAMRVGPQCQALCTHTRHAPRALPRWPARHSAADGISTARHGT